MTSTVDHLDAMAVARQVADTVLYEGYILYPYRASGQKNQARWQWGVLVPRCRSARASEPWYAQTECLIEPRPASRLSVTVRFLQIRERTVLRASGSRFRRVDALELADRQLVPWQEGIERTVEAAVPISALHGGEYVVPFRFAGGTDSEPVTENGDVVGRLDRRSWALSGRLRISVHPTDGPYGAMRLTVAVENRTGCGESGTRTQLMRHALAGTHAILALTDGVFLSMTDPPEWARPATMDCRNQNTWPVLVGRGRQDVLLSSPIILSDYPEIAPESPGSLYDATEIDEILSLRTYALTEEEKRQARGTDPRAAAVLEQVDQMPAEIMDRLHGAIRYLRSAQTASNVDPPWWDPGADASVAPETDRITINGRTVGNGSTVRLCLGSHRADAQDFFLTGRLATVHAVFHDVDGNDHLAVTLNDDPAADISELHGRFRYFRPDEVEPV